MEAIILAGGFGTRLQSVVKDVPKPMAPINDKPFLEYVVRYLITNGVNHIILAVGYKKDSIINYFKDKYWGVPIDYSVEDTPLFTGGAVKKALSKCCESSVFIVNGDTYFSVNLKEMYDNHIKNNADLTIAVKQMNNFDRYGTIEIEDNKKIRCFKEKRYCKTGLINGGIYCLKSKILSQITDGVFSFEKDYMEKFYQKDKMYAYISNGYFIDIGVPEDYFEFIEEQI